MNSQNTQPKASETAEVSHHNAANFVNASGERIVSLQLINNGHYAVAVADFRGGKLERFDCSPQWLNESKTWLNEVRKTYEG